MLVIALATRSPVTVRRPRLTTMRTTPKTAEAALADPGASTLNSTSTEMKGSAAPSTTAMPPPSAQGKPGAAAIRLAAGGDGTAGPGIHGAAAARCGTGAGPGTHCPAAGCGNDGCGNDGCWDCGGAATGGGAG